MKCKIYISIIIVTLFSVILFNYNYHYINKNWSEIEIESVEINGEKISLNYIKINNNIKFVVNTPNKKIQLYNLPDSIYKDVENSYSHLVVDKGTGDIYVYGREYNIKTSKILSEWIVRCDTKKGRVIEKIPIEAEKDGVYSIPPSGITAYNSNLYILYSDKNSLTQGVYKDGTYSKVFTASINEDIDFTDFGVMKNGDIIGFSPHKGIYLINNSGVKRIFGEDNNFYYDLKLDSEYISISEPFINKEYKVKLDGQYQQESLNIIGTQNVSNSVKPLLVGWSIKQTLKIIMPLLIIYSIFFVSNNLMYKNKGKDKIFYIPIVIKLIISSLCIICILGTLFMYRGAFKRIDENADFVQKKNMSMFMEYIKTELKDNNLFSLNDRQAIDRCVELDNNINIKVNYNNNTELLLKYNVELYCINTATFQRKYVTRDVCLNNDEIKYIDDKILNNINIAFENKEDSFFVDNVSKEGRVKEIYKLLEVDDKNKIVIRITQNESVFSCVKNQSYTKVLLITIIGVFILSIAMIITTAIFIRPLKSLIKSDNTDFKIKKSRLGNNEFFEIADVLEIMAESTQNNFTHNNISNGIYHKFVSSEIFEILNKNNISYAKCGDMKRIKATVMYIKLYNQNQEELQDINASLNIIINAITVNRGVISEFGVSHLTAFFPISAENAVKTLEHLRSEIKNAVFAISDGNISVGIIGCEERLSAVISSNELKLVKHMCSIGEKYKCPVLITENVIKLIPEYFDNYRRFVGQISLKNKSITNKIKIYESYIGYDSNSINFRREICKSFDKGLELFINQSLKDARGYFIEVLRKYNNDTFAREYLRRCELYIQNDGIIDYDTYDILESGEMDYD